MNKFTKPIAAIMLIVAAIIVAGCNKPDEPADNSGTLNGHEYIDLGLPSGTLWAACNVGADSIADYGDSFAWGETSPKETYNWENYKYLNYATNMLTKYCVNDWGTHDGEYGFEDLLTELEAIDDAATVNWGDGWRTPTVDDWRELRDNCFHDTITQNNVHGHLFKSPNGNSIFLPVTSGPYSVFGDYWSSSLDAELPHYAFVYTFRYYVNDHGVTTRERFRGRAVRPVCSGE